MKILVVEDEKKVAKFLKQGLEEEHYAVDVAHDGAQGEAMASTGSYDLIVLDILLPKREPNRGNNLSTQENKTCRQLFHAKTMHNLLQPGTM